MFGGQGGFGGGGQAGGGGAFGAAGAINYNPNNDVLLAQGTPDDSVSALAWTHAGAQIPMLAATSWDGKLRIWAVDPNSGQTQGKHIVGPNPLAQNLPNVLLDCSWEHTHGRVFYAGVDGKAYACDVNTGQSAQVAQHDAPIKVCKWINAAGNAVLATGSWDKSLKYWDTRSPNPIATIQMKGKIYCADWYDRVGVVCTSDRSIYVFDMNNPQKEHKCIQSPLKYQTRAVACSPDKSNFALGSIEGRVAIHYIAESQRSQDFAFKCHREGNEKAGETVRVYAVNCLAWHMQEGTFATGGSDGTFNIWDKDARSRCKAFEKLPSPVTALAFSPDGKMLAYAHGYDWSRGSEHYNANIRPAVLIHGVKPEEVKKKPPGSGNKR